MQKFLSKYGLAAHLALVAVAPLFLSPVCVLWLTGLAVIWILMEPSRIGDESLGEAHRRVFRSIWTDPFFWLSVVLLTYALVRYFNDGVSMAYDAETKAWAVSKPKMPILPGSVRGHGAVEMATAFAFCVVLQGCRHALGRSARMVFALVVSALSGIGAVVLAALLSMNYAFALALVECHSVNPSYLGTAMGAYSLLGTVALLAVYERRWLKAMPLTVFSIGGNAAGLFLFAPPMVQVVWGCGEILLLLYAFFYARKHLPGSGEFKFLVTFSIALTLGVVLVVATLPEQLLNARIAVFRTGAFFPDKFMVVRGVLSDISLKVWKSYAWLGTGLGSFTLGMRFHAAEADWAVVVPEQLAPLNGYWCILSERGIIGLAFILCPAAFLLWTYGANLVRGIARGLPHPACWVGPLALIAIGAESAIDASLTIPGVLLAVALMMALSASSFPKEKCNG